MHRKRTGVDGLSGRAAEPGQRRVGSPYICCFGLLTLTGLLAFSGMALTGRTPASLQAASLELVNQAICLVRSPTAGSTPAQQTRARRRQWAQQRSTSPNAPTASDPS